MYRKRVIERTNPTKVAIISFLAIALNFMFTPFLVTGLANSVMSTRIWVTRVILNINKVFTLNLQIIRKGINLLNSYQEAIHTFFTIISSKSRFTVTRVSVVGVIILANTITTTIFWVFGIITYVN